MLKIVLELFILISAMILFSAERIQKEDLVWQKDKENIEYKDTYTKTIQIGNELKMDAQINTSSRNNGIMRIANLNLVIMQSSYFICFYHNNILDIDFTDINNDGFKDIVISGIVSYMDERNTDIILRHEPVLFIYLFDPVKKIYQRTYINASFHLEDGPNASRNIPVGTKELDQFIEKSRDSIAIENLKDINSNTREIYSLQKSDFHTEDFNKICNKTIKIGKNINIKMLAEIRPWQDGWLKIANLNLNFQGKYFNAGSYDMDKILSVDFVDINNDGFLDIVISGMLRYQTNSEDNVIMTLEPAVFIYLFDPAKKEFRCVYRNASFKLEEPASKYVESRVSEVKNAIYKLNSSLEKKRIELAVPEFKQAVSQ